MGKGQRGTSPIGVQKYLQGIDYPASKEDLLSTARDNQAPAELLDLLQQLPGTQYEGPDEVMEAYRKLT